jgi:RNA recognition motif-containing protein
MDVEPKKAIFKPRTLSPGRKEGRRIIKVSNIDPSTSWRDLKEAFSSCGPVERCDVDGTIAIIIFRI